MVRCLTALLLLLALAPCAAAQGARDSAGSEAAWRAAIAALDTARLAGDTAPDRRDSLNAVAEQLARRAVEADSGSADAWFSLAYALGRTALTLPATARVRQAEEIRAAALRAIELDPEHSGAYHVLGRWHAEIMRLPGISRFLARNLLGARVFSEASWEAAIENLERAVALDSTYIYHRLDLAEVLIERDQWSAARVQLEAIPSLPDRDVLDAAYRERAKELLAEIADRE